MSLTASGGGTCQGVLVAKAVHLALHSNYSAIRAGLWEEIAAACKLYSSRGVVALGAPMTPLTVLGWSQCQGGWVAEALADHLA